MTDKKPRRHEPDRRSRIIDTTLDVIAQYGVAGTTHRRVAEAADVPLGAMTYYFASINELLQEAFARLVDTMFVDFRTQMDLTTTKEQACQAIIDWACSDMWKSRRNLILIFEFTAFAARDASLRPQLLNWLALGESNLSRYFDKSTAKMIDAFLDGVIMRNILSENFVTNDEIADFIKKIAQ